MENYLTFINTSIDISVRQPPPINILVLVQETLFINLQYKEINKLLEKSIFAVIIKKDILQGVRIFNLYFINKIKHFSTNKAYKKSRLII